MAIKSGGREHCRIQVLDLPLTRCLQLNKLNSTMTLLYTITQLATDPRLPRHHSRLDLRLFLHQAKEVPIVRALITVENQAPRYLGAAACMSPRRTLVIVVNMVHHTYSRIESPGDPSMVVAGQFACKVEIAVAAGWLENVCVEGAELPRRELRKGAHGELVVVPVEPVEIERLLDQHFPEFLYALRVGVVRRVQYRKVLVYLVEKYLLRRQARSGRIRVYGTSLGVSYEGPETCGILVPWRSSADAKDNDKNTHQLYETINTPGPSSPSPSLLTP